MRSEPQSGHEIDLSLVVPVWNAKEHLQKLVSEVQQLDRLGVTWQLIFVDDGSTDGSDKLALRLAAENPKITAFRNPENLGAGAARNHGWQHVVGRYTIFFDADDNLHAEVIPATLAQMDALQNVDVAFFAYRYEREKAANFTAMGHNDADILRYYLKGDEEVVAPLEKVTRLLHFTNYPWNKILRTDHFQNCGLKFGSTKVHNDILGHWHSLIFARNILVTSKVICTHIVHPSGNNLTNRVGSDRLQIFDAMSELYDTLEANYLVLRKYSHLFWGLLERLVSWYRPRIEPEFREQLEYRYSDLITRIDLEDFARMRVKRDPELAKTISRHLLT